MGAVPAERLFSIIVKGRPSFYGVETPLQRPGAEIDEGEKLGIEKTARNLFKLGALSDEQIAEATGLALDEVAKLRIEGKR